MTLAACALLASPAFAAKARFTIRGAGFGHGVGMSQYGALGFAQHGRTYDQILRHYYTGTALGTTDPAATVRVLLQSTGTASFSGASRAGSRCVTRADLPGAPPRLHAGRPAVGVGAADRQLHRAAAGGRPRRRRPAGRRGAYRGLLEFRPDPFGGVNAINAVSLEDYVAGVVSRESPSSWPAEALKAQAVAARTYAITTSKAGDGWDQYADTRSQVYGGVAAETASTNAAGRRHARAGRHLRRRAGRHLLLLDLRRADRERREHQRRRRPQPHLKSVDDPYDNVSPKHRWTPIKLTLAQAGAKLAGLVKGRFKGIQVLERGRSPRIVAADIVGSAGRTRVDGATLRARLGLLDTWAYFTTIATRKAPPPAPGASGRRRPAAARRRGGLGGPGARRRRGPDPGPRGRELGDRRVHGRAARRALPRGGRPRRHLPRRLLGRRGAVDPRARNAHRFGPWCLAGFAISWTRSV